MEVTTGKQKLYWLWLVEGPLEEDWSLVDGPLVEAPSFVGLGLPP